MGFVLVKETGNNNKKNIPKRDKQVRFNSERRASNQ